MFRASPETLAIGRANPHASPFTIMRVDRELSTKVFHPLRRARFWDRGLRVPILTYHSILNIPEHGVAPAARTATDPFVFRQQMRFLITAGCNPADLTQLIAWLRDGVRPPDKTVVLTFDHGLRDFYTNAFPVLQEHSFPATVFLPTEYIGVGRNWFNKRECLTWPEVRELRAAGIRFGSQTVSHPYLADLSRIDVMRELALSKAEIERVLGEPVTALAYPHDFPRENSAFAPEFRDLAIKAGYSCCVTNDLGRVKPGDDVYRLKRMPINTLDTEPLFDAKLEGGYDWHAWPRSILRNLKRKRKPKSQG
jgi:peptidoglycan/xylan/chitin deacetylase (PgdA/CDA1 family)